VRRLVVAGALVAAAFALSMLFPLLPRARCDRMVHRWARLFLAALGVRLAMLGPGRLSAGDAGPTGTLVVAKHVSWLDVVALLAVAPVGMLAKQETRTWPVIGTIANRLGTVYADRERLRSLPQTVADLAAMLRAGRSVAVFPEGTTWCGTSWGRLRPAMFQAAVEAGAPVRPVVLRYRLADGRPTTAAAYIGDDTLWASLYRIVALDGLTVEIRPRPVLPFRPGIGRRDLARAAETQLALDSLPAGHPLEGNARVRAHARETLEDVALGPATTAE
jgi:1-acyl-sn-glycerol-3-phosphate acyltransferase